MTMQETNVGSMNFNVLANLLMQGNVIKLGRGAEIGVLYGDTSEYLLRTFPNLTLFCVDPYLPYEEDGADRSAKNLENYEEIAHRRLAPFGARAQFVKDFSVNAALSFADESLDFVFIDALHEYEAVKADLQAWYPKVRRDGLVAGHDYRWQGVGQAVVEFGEARRLQGFFTPASSDIWFFVKP